MPLQVLIFLKIFSKASPKESYMVFSYFGLLIVGQIFCKNLNFWSDLL